MKIGEIAVQHLAKAVCGDVDYMPYLSGPDLIRWFNTFGFDDTYGSGFPSRWKFTEDKIRELNGTPRLKKLIEEAVDPRRYTKLKLSVDNAVTAVNDFLKYDNYELRKVGHFFKLVDSQGMLVESDTVNEIGHEFIDEQIQKCKNKIIEGDFNGAITNARTLVEAVLIEIIERHEGKEIKNDGDLDNLYKRAKKVLNLEVNKANLPDTVLQILSGLNSITSGLAGLSNNSADRHANKFRTAKHHAKLAVNSAMTLCEFLIESKDYQGQRIK